MQEKKKHLWEAHELRRQIRQVEEENRRLGDRIREITKESENLK